MNKLILCGCAAAVSLATAAFAGNDSVWYLDGVNGDDANDGATRETAVKTFQRAWKLLEHGQRQKLYICPGTYDVTWDGAIEFSGQKYTRFIGLGDRPTDVVFDLGGTHKNFFGGWYDGSTLENLTVQHGSADDFAVSLPWSGGMVSNCVFRSNPGGALRFHGANTKVVDCLFEDNGSGRHDKNGGALHYDWAKDDTAIAEIIGCTFRRNGKMTTSIDWGYSEGGAVYFEYANGLVVRDSWFEENEVQRLGGAIFVSQGSQTYDGDYTFVVSNCVFVGNKANQGAAINMGADERTTKTLAVYDCFFSNNVGRTWGAVNAPLRVCRNSVFVGNRAPKGAAFSYNYYSGGWSPLPNGFTPPSGCGYFITNRFEGCTFERNAATEQGGCATWSYKNNVAFSNCVFRANAAPQGDVLVNNDHFYLGFDACVFEDHVSTNQLVHGLDNTGYKVHLRRCTVRNNTCLDQALMKFNYADVIDCVFTNNAGAAPVMVLNGNNNETTNILRNCLFADNRNTSADHSGAIYFEWQCFFNSRTENCTFTGNRSAVAPYGVGGFTYSHAKSFCNNLVFGNGPIDDPTAAGIQVYANCLGNDADPVASNCYFQAGAQDRLSGQTLADRGFVIGDDPKFSDAAVGDYTLRRASKARDRGLLLGWMTEQATDLTGRNPRVFGGRPDIGAYEWCGRSPGGMLSVR